MSDKDDSGNSGTGFQPVTALLHKTKRNLPHWQMGGGTYFITFNTKGFELGFRERKIVFDATLFWQGRKWKVHQLVVMPDHVHLLATPIRKEGDGEEEWHSLAEIIHSVKRFSANTINKLRGRSGALWWDERYDRLIRNEGEFRQKWEYIRQNPIRKGLALKPEDYEFYYEERSAG